MLPTRRFALVLLVSAIVVVFTSFYYLGLAVLACYLLAALVAHLEALEQTRSSRAEKEVRP